MLFEMCCLVMRPGGIVLAAFGFRGKTVWVKDAVCCVEVG
jgi:hypothetical protein